PGARPRHHPGTDRYRRSPGDLATGQRGGIVEAGRSLPPGGRMRLVLSALLILVPTATLEAQGLRGTISELFIFGEGEEALFLGGSGNPNNPQNVQVHGAHFVPAAVSGNATIISFLTSSIGTSVGSLPVSAASGGSTFRFEGGAPVRTS